MIEHMAAVGSVMASNCAGVPPIYSLGVRLDVTSAVEQIEANPELWNQYTLRTERYGTPHNAVSDIWVRYNAFENLNGDPVSFTQMPHRSEWYPCVNDIPAVKRLAENVYKLVGGTELGGVLITRIPPGGEVKPHIDTGWHAEYYSKYAVQLKGNKDQTFYFEDCELRPLTGDLYSFDNSKLHGVKNDSDEDRMTLIICIRR